MPTYKILLVGDAGVGKSNLVTRFTKEKFDIHSRATIGVEFVTRQMDVGCGMVCAQLWDTAGQERCGAISSTFYRGARGVVVVYDTTSKKTLLNVPRWVAYAKQFVDVNCVFVVVGNKSDLTNLCEVTDDDAEEICHILGVRHFRSSALTGDGVPNAFFQLVLSVHAVSLTQGIATPCLPSGLRLSPCGDGAPFSASLIGAPQSAASNKSTRKRRCCS